MKYQIDTWKDLQQILKQLTPEQLDQPARIFVDEKPATPIKEAWILAEDWGDCSGEGLEPVSAYKDEEEQLDFDPLYPKGTVFLECLSQEYLAVLEKQKPMKVYKFYSGDLFYGYAAKSEDQARAALIDYVGETNIDQVEEIPESKWDEKNIEMYEDNDTEKEPFYVSIREEMGGDKPHLVFTNDRSLID